MVKKIIPCLDVKDGRVVKGIQFVGLRDAGDPAELAAFYDKEGADELVFLDISASVEGRDTMLEAVKKTAAQISIPLIVGGGIRTTENMKQLLDAGASKVSINSAAISNPAVITEGAKTFGSNKIIAAIDVKWSEEEQDWFVYTHGGQKRTDWKAVDWAIEVEKLGAGEILLTSMDRDGEKDGYDIEITKRVKEAVSIPITASGGAGNVEHILAAFTEANADAALAASIFHFKETSVAEVKNYIRERGVEVK
ncbi:imidazole glycerol phosphate synthase subunit HisF [Psychrobacillus lasiicapitis]|uniref:Imidazole glycerol phosphate synthase subunit HisF n=1 Tax=Psychrobacillus lasiicapitis TaxID=1636719 RepID=A0A544SZN2_9BACI|nr:imidazole glycerol phosphate synthase subunit HisF [Psychrobacillus lasiicapitis]TQR10658.1 imidazole glycerol phosphate synthase subunit HisF [Psychrobacillus lasiicapitis]GGA43691.1 imidazole glycerol phosphate synthase subunit HisF [Psychrobacillus lasiicapitis]